MIYPSTVFDLLATPHVILCDVWGVVHNGIRPYAQAVQTLTEARQRGHVVVLISNSPRPKADFLRQMAQIGVNPECYDGVVTSGDVCRQLLLAKAHAPLFHLGPQRDKALLEGLNLHFVDEPHADVILCTGLFDDDHETVADYEGRLLLYAKRNALMICANPDLVVEKGDRLLPCAGALAKRYAELGGLVHHTGKPHLPIYEAALEMAGATSLPRLAIGDGMLTDVQGGLGAQAKVLLIAHGIHRHDVSDDGQSLNPAKVALLAERYGFAPHAVMMGLA